MYLAGIQQAEIHNLKLWFDSVDTDRGGTIEPHELANLNIDGYPIGFPLALKLIKVFDKDRNGRIDFWEYCALHKFLLSVRQAFFVADTDRSGRLAAQEINSALIQVGFSYLGFPTVMELLNKYDPQRIGLGINDFCMLAAQVAHTRSLFEWLDTDRDGIIHVNLDQFNNSVAYLS